MFFALYLQVLLRSSQFLNVTDSSKYWVSSRADSGLFPAQPKIRKNTYDWCISYGSVHDTNLSIGTERSSSVY